MGSSKVGVGSDDMMIKKGSLIKEEMSVKEKWRVRTGREKELNAEAQRTQRGEARKRFNTESTERKSRDGASSRRHLEGRDDFFEGAEDFGDVGGLYGRVRLDEVGGGNLDAEFVAGFAGEACVL